MKRPVLMFGSVIVLGLLGVAPALAAKCPPDSVQVGPTCVDKYEASVWQIPATNPQGKSNAGRISKVKDGKATLADLTAAGATQRGLGVAPRTMLTHIWHTRPYDETPTAPGVQSLS
jgi:hypothetical protein